MTILSSLYTQFCQTVASVFSKQSEENTLQNLQTFGPDQWKTFAQFDVEVTKPPSYLLDASKKPSPTIPEKETGQTHILCCVPKDMSIAKLYEIAGKSTDFLAPHHFDKNPKTYWCWVAINPALKGFNFELQKSELSKVECDVPTRLELMTVIYAARHLENMVLFSDEENASTCKDGNTHSILGGDSKATFCGYKPCWKSIGVSSVIR